jgi:hypothetical protein
MPCASSVFGVLAQSLQTMQWVRWLAGGGRLEYFVVQSVSWDVKKPSSEDGV